MPRRASAWSASSAAFEVENATLGRRMGAVLYDSLLLFALLFLGTLPFIWLSGGESVAPGTLTHQLAMLCIAWAFFAG